MAMTVDALAHPNHISKPMDIMWHANCYKQFSSGIFFSSTKRTTFRAMRKKRVAFAEIVRNKFSAAVDVEKTAAAMMLELTALVTVRKSQKKIINVMDMMFHWFDKHTLDSHNQEGVVLQLVSTETESNRMSPKWSDEARLVWTKNLKMGSDQKSVYEVKFMVDPKFGKPGAITVSNGYENEFYLESVDIEGVVDFPCNSWVQPQRVMSVQRIFFCSKAYLPGGTPEGLKELREMELRQLRGDGKGLRTPSDRIYDYDTYNDIGNPDKGMEFVRPTLGGNKNPHPRRCRTGRPPTKTDENMESPVNESTTIYVPRDEEFEEAKQEALDVGKLKGILRHIIPTVTAIVRDSKFFKSYSDINGLYSNASLLENKKQKMKLPLPKIFNKVQENLKFDPPKLISRDTSCCLRDDEFGRQAVAGINPLSIERLTVFPPVSKLDPSIYGSQESALEEEHLIGHLEGIGVAIPDPTQSHGLRLLIEDYPYATDGLLIWSAIERLVQTYVNYYYPDASLVQSDTELHAWYHESINIGHADLSHASWWPKLSTPNDLIAILTTIIWITTAQHAALNFGQYPYGGYVPTRPPHMRRLVPNQHDDPDEYANFIREPQQYFLSSLPSFFEATKYMAVIDIISAHSPDEEYIGERKDLLSTWSADTEIVEAFYRFSMEMKKIEKEIEGRNGDSNLRNRCGAGVSPYELLMPSSEPGVTCRGVPNKHDPEYAAFIRDPQKYFLASVSGLFEATKYMAVIEILSTHSPDEEYIGGRKDFSTWSADMEENPRRRQHDVADRLPQPVPGEVLHPPLEIAPPQRHENVEQRAPLGEEALELAIFHEGDHEQQEADREEEEAREGVAGPNQELVVGGGPQQLLGGLDPVPEGVDFRHVEHHECPAGYGD
ncbi:unnamed protein product [Malus baccata var. baccata]